jgi:hypothetical protein
VRLLLVGALGLNCQLGRHVCGCRQEGCAIEKGCRPNVSKCKMWKSTRSFPAHIVVLGVEFRASL